MSTEQNHRKQNNQKLKTFLIWNYLSKYTDEYNYATCESIIAELDFYGIEAERRSVVRDIDQMNLAFYMMNNECSLDEAEKDLKNHPEYATIQHKRNRGYYIVHDNYSVDNIRLIAECIYAANFIDKTQVDELVEILKPLVSEYQFDGINNIVNDVDRVRTSNYDMFQNIALINSAIVPSLNKYKKPVKIYFYYRRRSIDNVANTVYHRGGMRLLVSPYQIILDNNHYYLHCYEDGIMKNYRIDKMEDVKLIGYPRDGEEIAKAEKMHSYTKSVFGMFGGEKKRVKIKFIRSLLDTVVDKLGMDMNVYNKIDPHHFTIVTNVEVSPQFYSWLCGFGTSAEILEPEDVREDFQKYVLNIAKKYKK